MERPIKVLNRLFGYKEFRNGQFEIINNILKKRDSFCIMPTGGGKSICYQIPAFIFDGITIVISPLIALMKDQVDNINNIGIKAKYINSTNTLDEVKEIIDMCYLGQVKLLYISPERLKNNYFINAIKTLNISQIAIDEAHCISMWGHDFRKSYRDIEGFVRIFRNRPVVSAFTATATKEVLEDSIKLLNLNNPYIYKGSFDRENLEINVHKEIDKLEFIRDFLKENEEKSGIIYCLTRKEVEALYDYLNDLNFSVLKYHAGLSDSEKEYYQKSFFNDDKDIMIATNAFGMGIDKENIRFIIHFTFPKNIESYYQEIGRGGRDGEKAVCHLLYSRDDIKRLDYIVNLNYEFNRKEINIKKLNDMIKFCEYDKCYREYILNYFNEKDITPYCNNCSNCLNNEELLDITIEAQKILSCVYRTKELVGESVLIDILKGIRGPKIEEKGFYNLTTFGIMKGSSNKIIKEIIKSLIDAGYIDRKKGTYSMVKLNKKSINILKGKEKALVKLNPLDYTPLDEELFRRFKILRKNLSNKESIRPYMVFSDTTIMDIIKISPRTIDELFSVKGLGEKKIFKYGEAIINLINSYYNNLKEKN
ncbi:MAG: DNA helicase RecQ [Sarcina ventriculi]|uniref:DNA helicase RecQ n=1 Tax=Sarcina ventriculi TaxID=1267 RepID=UPI00073F767E|nr:DNA helicase RecQ [Sarcina ventriculi]MCI5635737.1 DNA helicase RecQ [Sarcina ventriculi]MDD7374396.1 DNA helicase RecQ [Sarcina ventriculi]MDY7062380.1 DNA helicase RecQ [Sarcina ventriculi]